MPGNTKIIVVEDEQIIAIDIKRSLIKMEYDVIATASKGEDAVRLASDLRPDIFLMDINLNGKMDGTEAASIIYNNYDIPVIFLTALSDTETLEKAKTTEPFGYIIKPFESRLLKTTIEMALYKHKIETELKKRTKELEEEKIRTDNLLSNILPLEIVNEYKTNGFITPRLYKNISIMFADLQEFPNRVSILNPRSFVNELNNLFYDFDSIIEENDVEKLKTIGDSYMIGAGLPVESEDHAIKLIDTAFKLQNYLFSRNENSGIKWRMRIGINSGQVVAGVVGTNKFSYDIWGDSVNIASRIENSCEPGMINISGTTYNLIKDVYQCEYRGKLNAKGKGEIDMYYVKKKKS